MAVRLCTASVVNMCNIIILLVSVVNWKQAIGQQFLPDMKDVSVLEGESVTVKCFLEGELSEHSRISWWKSDCQISTKNDIIIKDPRLTANLAEFPDTNKIMYWLVISLSVPQDEGDYYCRISNPYEIQSESAYVTILQKPSGEYPQCLKSKDSYIAGSNIKLTCISEVVLPPVELRWSRRPTLLMVPPMRVSIEIRDTIVYKYLQFTATKEDNEEMFVCEQDSEVMSETLNCTINDLNIQYTPEVKIRHTNAIYAGSDSILFCQSVANPPVMTFRWTFQPMLEAYEYKTEGQVLRLFKLAVTRNGTNVTCTATNTVGTSVDSTRLYILNENNVNGDATGFENNGKKMTKDNHSQDSKGNDIANSQEENSQTVSFYVIIIIIVLVVIIVVVVVIIPVYYQCFCKTRTATDSSSREIYQPSVYYDTRSRNSNSGLYDRSLPRLPSTGQYGHWRHSFASQVPEDLEQQGYMYIEERNGQNKL